MKSEGDGESRLSASTRRCHPAVFLPGDGTCFPFTGASFPIDSVGTVAAAGKPQSQSYAAGAAGTAASGRGTRGPAMPG